MTTLTLSSRELNQDIGRAKRATRHGPVIITNRGEPEQVLLSYTDYQRLTSKQPDLLKALSMPGLADIDFEPVRSQFKAKPANFD